jgi:carnitine 3-dehydrogenase
MMIHVSLATRKASEPEPAVAATLARVTEAHSTLPVPEGAGKAVGVRG